MKKDQFAAKPQTGRRVLRIIFIVLFALFTVYTFADVFSNDQSVGFFDNIEGKKKYMDAYAEVMAAMPAPTFIDDINTSWGTVRVYQWQNKEYSDRIPVVLLPGHSSGSPMWQANIAGFSQQHTVYAMDALGDAGKSVQTVPLTNIQDVADWISETLTGLGIQRAHMVGHSFGGGYAANFTLYHPEQVQTLTLLEPAFALNFPSFSILFWATVGSLDFLPESWRNVGLARISGESPADVASEDPMARMISAASSFYTASLPTPQTLTTADLANLNMPVYVALAEQSPLTGAKAAENARLIPHATVKIWQNTTHSLPMEVADALAAELTQFWNDNEH